MFMLIVQYTVYLYKEINKLIIEFDFPKVQTTAF